MKEEIRLMKIVIDFLNQLSEEQLNDLLLKKARITIEPTVEKEVMNKMIDDKYQLSDIYKQVDCLASREEARAFFVNMSFPKKVLKNIAETYEIPVSSKDTNEFITEKIIETLVGSKLRFDALLSIDLG